MREGKAGSVCCQSSPSVKGFCTRISEDIRFARTKVDTEGKEGVWIGHFININEAFIGTIEGVLIAYSFRGDTRYRDGSNTWYMT